MSVRIQAEPSALVGPDVCEDGYFGWKRHVRVYKVSEELRKSAPREPEADRVEKEFVAAISIFFTSGEFIVDGKRHTFFETLAGVCGQSHQITTGCADEVPCQSLQTRGLQTSIYPDDRLHRHTQFLAKRTNEERHYDLQKVQRLRWPQHTGSEYR